MNWTEQAQSFTEHRAWTSEHKNIFILLPGSVGFLRITEICWIVVVTPAGTASNHKSIIFSAHLLLSASQCMLLYAQQRTVILFLFLAHKDINFYKKLSNCFAKLAIVRLAMTWDVSPMTVSLCSFIALKLHLLKWSFWATHTSEFSSTFVLEQALDF